MDTNKNSRPLGQASDVAERLCVGLATAYELTRQGLIPGIVRVGRRVRYDLDAIDAWIAAGGQALPGGWRREPKA